MWPAPGPRLQDVDGHAYTDFCLGDTGAMFGHSPAPVAAALARQAAQGITAMLPGEGCGVGGRGTGLALRPAGLAVRARAPDANRFAIRWARALTGRDQVLIFNGCYHGTASMFVDLVDGQPCTRDSLLGQVVDITRTTRSIEFNDLAALEAALADGQVACLLAEPAMTNIGMVLPEPGFWEAAQALCRRHGTLLLIDETHTISTGPGGYTRAHGSAAGPAGPGQAGGRRRPARSTASAEAARRRAEQAKRDARWATAASAPR
jgi:glutamate-1-semialdehyde 2,1-aminomutase